MTDSTDNTNDLDSYGVWVKRPAKTSSDGTPVKDDTDNFNPDADLPDFSEIDISSVASDIPADTADKLQDDTTLSPEELSDITGTIDTAEAASPEKPDEVSLEDFLDEGFSDPGAKESPVQDSAAEEQSAASSGESEDISLDDFLDSDFSADEQEKQNTVPDEAPLDINLSFSSDEPAAETPESVIDEAESTDLAVPAEEIKETSGDTPASATDNFDDMFNSISDAQNGTEIPSGEPVQTEYTADEPEKEEAAPSEIETENIDLSDFGIDAEAEETPVTSNIAENKPKDEAVDYDLTVTEDSTAAAPVVNEVKSPAGSSGIPDTFDEEADSLIGTSSEKSEKTASDTTVVGNTLLQQIVADLSGLKNEISSLKNEFAELKAHEELTAAGTSGKQTGKGGFFAEQDEDDTIALSGDELDNIMNTADFSGSGKENAPVPEQQPEKEPIGNYEEVSDLSEEAVPEPSEEPAAEPAPDLEDDSLFGTIDSSVPVPETPAVDDSASSALTMNFDNEKLEEPDLDDIHSDAETETIPDELPEEISIPKVDDILVESSPTDFMDSIKDTTEDAVRPDEDTEKPAVEEISPETEIQDISPAEEQPAQEDAVDISSAEPEESSAAEEFEEPKVDGENQEDMFSPEPSVSDSLTKDNIDYLNTDEAAEKSQESAAPLDSGTEENNPPDEKTQSLPADLTQEVKSVLLYMDQLLENLPEDKIIEFARSEHFTTYKKLFSDLGLS